MLTYTEYTTKQEYKDQTWNIIQNVEGVEYSVYADSKGIPTIGAGFNLTVPQIRDAVFKEFGFQPDHGDPAIAALENDYINQLNTAIDSGSTDLQTMLNAIMQDRANNTAYVGSGVVLRSSFTFSPVDVGLGEMHSVFNSIHSFYDDRITSWLAGIPDSKERAVLFSLAYNNPVLLGKGLRDAISAGNRAEAWFEIRYRSNGGSSDGIAKRRYYEAEVFGLYDDGTTAATISDAEARQVYQMYTKHRADIHFYEGFFSIMIPQANSDYGAQVQTLSESFAIAGDYMNFGYVAGTGYTGAIDPLSIQVGGDSVNVLDGAELDDPFTDGHDLLLGGGGNDHLYGKSGNDVLYGEGGLDVLEGGAGDDYLNGGSGHDIYVINDGEGTDHIVDSGANTVVVNGTPVTHLISDGAGGYILKGTTITATHNSSLTITDSSGAGASVVIDNWQEGDFGIKLTDTPDTTATQAITLPGYHDGTVDADDDAVVIDGNTAEGRAGTVLLGIMIDYAGDPWSLQTAAPIDAVYAGEGNDIVNLANIANNPGIKVYGGNGNDYVGFAERSSAPGTEGAYLYGEAGSDAMGGSNMDDWLDGGFDHDGLEGFNGKDILLGDRGNDALFGGDGQDDLLGGEDDDYLFGGAGADQLFGSSGNDKLYGDTEVGTVNIPLGEIRTFTFWDGQNFIRYPIDLYYVSETLLELHTVQDVDAAEVGNDLLSGGEGEDLIFGGGGDDHDNIFKLTSSPCPLPSLIWRNINNREAA